jgi:hypothetical protein
MMQHGIALVLEKPGMILESTETKKFIVFGSLRRLIFTRE